MDTKLRCFWNWRTKMERRKFAREFKIERLRREIVKLKAARDI